MTPIIKRLGQVDYLPTWQQMQTLTQTRNAETPDEIWLLEHPPVYTQGQAGKAEHILNPGNIPIVQTDRGGQVTYHGPGQLVVYFLIDLRRQGLTLSHMVGGLEQAIINMLAEQDIEAKADSDARGVYVNQAKICSIGLRFKRGCSYHGIAFNINLDLGPFQGINPCGHQGLEVTQLAEFIPNITVDAAADLLLPHLLTQLKYPGAPQQ